MGRMKGIESMIGMAASRFLNPITLSFELLERYKTLLRDNLHAQGLGPRDIEEILQSMEVDRGIYFSINRKYRTGQTGFRQFCKDHSLADKLPDLFPNLDRLFVHQEKAIEAILANETTIASTGTGSGKTEAFLIPILDYCLQHPGPGVKAIIIYPMNALANDQRRRLEKAIDIINQAGKLLVTYEVFVGSTSDERRNAIRRDPPSILITNYVMLDWMLMRAKDRPIFAASQDTLKYVVLDEIHTYRGNKATHLKYLLARLKASFLGDIVQIGTSATLNTQTTQGYLESTEERLDSFIQSLLNVETYRFIKPEYEPDADVQTEPPFYIPDHDQEFEWMLEADPINGLINLGKLTGNDYSEFDTTPSNSSSFAQTKPYQDLQHNAFVKTLKLNLGEGTKSFVDFVGLLSSLLPPDYPRHKTESLVKAYLSAIAFMNFQAQGQPILDFRVHLFLRNIGGYLKKCIKCHKYHSGNQETCQECGFPLFCVYRDDIHQCIGKISGNRLKWDLRPESDDKRNSYYVLISSVDTGNRDELLPFEETLHATQDEIVLNYDVYGRLRLKLLSSRYDDVLKSVIPLIDRMQTAQYLHHLVKAILDFQPRERKKLLGFIDNREKASQYTMALQDGFADQFFEEYLKFCLQGDSRNVSSTLGILDRQKPVEYSSPVEEAIFKELNLWYWRFVSIPPRLSDSKSDLLELRDEEDFDEFHRELLNIFIAERAIFKEDPPKDEDSHYIKFSRYLAMNYKGIHCNGNKSSEDPRHPSISLGEHAEEHGEFVKKYGVERIATAIQELLNQGVLCAGKTPDEKRHYYISPSYVNITLPKSEYEDYDTIRDKFLLTAAVHCSEIKEKERRDVEYRFQDKRIPLNVVIATPTLEMGIDIGELENVLMIGVPPLPSNYAQRAGRAGRKQKTQYALIVTFCSEDDDHDSYYFQHPEQMINGVISPPTFDPFNPEVVKKHVNAFMLAGYVDARRDFERFCANANTEIHRQLPLLKTAFGEHTCAEKYLADEFDNNLIACRARLESVSLARLYATGFLPDHLFRRDQVYVVEAGETIGTEIQERILADVALSEREPELAYYKFSPGEIVFMAGDAYRITGQGYYEPLSINEQLAARRYVYLEAERQERYATKDKEYRKYERIEGFENTQSFVDKGKVLKIAFFPECRLFFVNQGLRQYDGIDRFSDGVQYYNIGYEIRRQAIVLRFDEQVCADEKLYLSLAAALDRTIKNAYGLDEGEIR
ncbi:MAG: DEAD/DEAH box helicase, partial [Anaerolineae bacterium]|nr:DEAD/DEAH box helicase [Anaerolineae bacterium]